MKKLFIVLCSTFFLFNVAVPVNSAFAFSLFPKQVCNAETGAKKECADLCNGEGVNSSVCQEPEDDNPAAKLLGSAANLIALIAGLVAVIMIIFAGFQFVTSAGNSEQTTKARGKITGAIIGLIIIALAWTIIRLITDYILK